MGVNVFLNCKGLFHYEMLSFFSFFLPRDPPGRPPPSLAPVAGGVPPPSTPWSHLLCLQVGQLSLCL